MLCSLLCEHWGLERKKDKDTFLRVFSFQWGIQMTNIEPTRKMMAYGINAMHSGKQGRVVREDPFAKMISELNSER